MNINKDYKIKAMNYIRSETKKTQLVIGNTYSYHLNHATQAIQRASGGYNRCPHFTITKDGSIFQHFDTKYYSMYLDSGIDERIVSIALENMGQLFLQNGKYYDLYNNHYSGEQHEKEWKGCFYWEPYSDEQFESALELSLYLLEELGLDKKAAPTNVKIPDVILFEGVCYRSNHDIKHYDVSPAWDFKSFKKQLENEQ